MIMSNKKLLNEFYFGFELEGTFDQSMNDYSSLTLKFDELLKGHGNMHRDGSLRSEYGYSCFEYSSPVIQFTPMSINMVIKFLDSLPSLGVKINNTCGFHTHISFKGITKKDAVWAMASMVADGSYTEFLKLGRTNLYKSPYAKATFLHKAKKLYDNRRIEEMADVLVDNEKYRSIRIHPQGTIEWRGPRTFLNVIKHSKNVAYFKKLSRFIKRINDSLDMEYSDNLSKKTFLDVANMRLNRLYFKEEKKQLKIQRLIESIHARPIILNNLSPEVFEALNDEISRGNFGISSIIRDMKINNIKITSDVVLDYFCRWTSITNFIDLIDVNTYKRNISMIGQRNGLTKSFEYLLKNPGINDEVLNMLTHKALTNFGSSQIKTFSYNAMLEMIKYNINAFKVAINKNLIDIFGIDRAINLIQAVIKVDMYSFRNSEIHNLLMNSINAPLVNRVLPEISNTSNSILDLSVNNILASTMAESEN